MRGPIDYIVVTFEGNEFKGEALTALQEAVDKGIINVIDLAVIVKDAEGNITSLEIENIDDDLLKSFPENSDFDGGLITEEDVEEIGDLLDNETAAGLLIIEQVWAIDLKRALLDANATLLAEGRIHPEAQKELDN